MSNAPKAWPTWGALYNAGSLTVRSDVLLRGWTTGLAEKVKPARWAILAAGLTCALVFIVSFISEFACCAHGVEFSFLLPTLLYDMGQLMSEQLLTGPRAWAMLALAEENV